MSERHTIIHLIEHLDGSMSSRRWVLTPERAHLAAAPLGDPTFSAYMEAEARARLIPLVNEASVVVDHREAA
ncbi:hypothetical protein [Micromonospora sp. NPDC047730]|uniref:hypothetical protein n=1 Tax=Micromonospora sp. NPDC047730 TaxID=3364253 RepID=UPI00371C00BA